MGTSSETNSAERVVSNSDTMPSDMPRSSDPESPMKIEAGLKL